MPLRQWWSGIDWSLVLRSFCFGLGTSLAVAFVAASASAGEFVIRNARIFDGERIIDATEVRVEGETIVEVGSNLAAAEGAAVIDAGGAFLMPGLIDCHTHTFDPTVLAQSVHFGVTTVLDMFTSVEGLAMLRAAEGARADIFSAGTLVTAPGGHGTQFGLPIPTITSPQEADAFVASRLDEGSDFIKIVYDGGRSVGISRPTLDLATLQAVIAAAHARGALAVVHIHDHQAATEAIDAGADGLVHTFIDALPDASIAALAKERGTFVIPTLAVIESVCGLRGGATLAESEALIPLLTPANVRALQNTFPIPADGPKRDYDVAKRSVAAFHAAGVPILAGTDAPNPGTLHGPSMHRELQLLVEAGLAPIDALRAATAVPAASFQLNDRGRIAPGMIADLLLVEGDPTADILDTRRIASVWKSGDLVDQAARRAEVAALREALAAGDRGQDLSLISDFDAGEPAAEFGSGWEVSTDRLMGGASDAAIAVVEGGAEGTAGSLRIAGELKAGSQFPWAGAMFYPGEQPFAPRNLSAKRAIVFRTRGDGGTYRVMLFAQSLGRIPAMRPFTAVPEWTTHRFEFAQFNNIDGSDVMGILFSASREGMFEFQIDDVRIE
jgi:imidazolonepropionase-like amidohydrolase